MLKYPYKASRCGYHTRVHRNDLPGSEKIPAGLSLREEGGIRKPDRAKAKEAGSSKFSVENYVRPNPAELNTFPH